MNPRPANPIAGHPVPGESGCYASLQLLTDHLESFMGAAIRSRLGTPVPLALMHDGTAAAAAYAGSPATIVITLGTAIGSGFPPPDDGYRVLHPLFAMSE